MDIQSVKEKINLKNLQVDAGGDENRQQFLNFMRYHLLFMFVYGSEIYGTQTDRSDIDFFGVVDDSVDLSAYENQTWEYDLHILDYQFVNKTKWIQMIEKHDIRWLECYPLGDTPYNLYISKGAVYEWLPYFRFDRWKMRQVISQIANNSWSKCHKKLVIEKDYDLYRAQKSLFHSLRLLMFGRQLGLDGTITDYKCANGYWDDIYNMCSPDAPFSEGESIWNAYKEKYKPVFNELRSRMVEICPKPADYIEEKLSKKRNERVQV